MGGDVFARARNLRARALACVIFHAFVRLVPSFWAKFFCARDDFEKSSGQVDVRRDFLDMRRSAEWIRDASEQKSSGQVEVFRDFLRERERLSRSSTFRARREYGNRRFVLSRLARCMYFMNAQLPCPLARSTCLRAPACTAFRVAVIRRVVILATFLTR